MAGAPVLRRLLVLMGAPVTVLGLHRWLPLMRAPVLRPDRWLRLMGAPVLMPDR